MPRHEQTASLARHVLAAHDLDAAEEQPRQRPQKERQAAVPQAGTDRDGTPLPVPVDSNECTPAEAAGGAQEPSDRSDA